MRLTRRTRVTADVRPGFPAAEAPALQTALAGVLTAAERATGRPVPVELTFDTGRGDVLAVVCRNRVVGFVPAEHAATVRAQRDDAGPRAVLVAPGVLHADGDLWRVWVGAVPDDGPSAADPGSEALGAPEPTVLGIPLRRTDD